MFKLTVSAGLGVCALFVPIVALAHPHGTTLDEDAQTVEETKTTKRVIRLKTTDDEGQTIDKTFRWSGEDLPMALEALKARLMDDDMIDDLTATVTEFVEKVEIESGSGTGTVLMFDDEDVVRFKRDRDVSDGDRMSLSGLGRNLTIDRETVIEDGETRTRIVIEMDGGEDVEIDWSDDLAGDAP